MVIFICHENTQMNMNGDDFSFAFRRNVLSPFLHYLFNTHATLFVTKKCIYLIFKNGCRDLCVRQL